MVNVFLQYTIAIPFLIILLMRAASHSCVYNRSEMVEHHKYVLQKHIDRVKKSLDTNYSTCCKTRKDTSATIRDVCNNFTKVDDNRKNFEEDCYSSSRNLTFCCQFKNLYYSGCLLNHYSKNLRRNNNLTAITELKTEVSSLVLNSNKYLCINATNKGSSGAAKEMAPSGIQHADPLNSSSEGKSTTSHRKSNSRVRRKHNIRNPPDDAIRGGADAPVRSQIPKRSKRGQQLDNENCRKICKLSETFQIYVTRWQEFLTSNDCS